MTATTLRLSPRKSPVQARSAATIRLLHVAVIQVLTKDGLNRCTTTRIAERAGMSVGSIYQYYPNRDALLADVLRCHLVELAEAIEDVCERLSGKPVSDMASNLTKTFLAVKLNNPEQSKALYAIAAERGAAELVKLISVRMVEAIAAMLSTAPHVYFEKPIIVATLALSAVVGAVRAVLEGYAAPNFEAAIEGEVTLILTAYLQSFALKREADDPDLSAIGELKLKGI